MCIRDRYKVIAMAKSFGIKTKHRQIKNIAIDLADALLADLSRTEPDEYKVITACAAPERQKVWKDMDILPISAYHEVFEAYHKTDVYKRQGLMSPSFLLCPAFT